MASLTPVPSPADSLLGEGVVALTHSVFKDGAGSTARQKAPGLTVAFSNAPLPPPSPRPTSGGPGNTLSALPAGPGRGSEFSCSEAARGTPTSNSSPEGQPRRAGLLSSIAPFLVPAFRRSRRSRNSGQGANERDRLHLPALRGKTMALRAVFRRYSGIQ
jgi:hypothetical protein